MYVFHHTLKTGKKFCVRADLIPNGSLLDLKANQDATLEKEELTEYARWQNEVFFPTMDEAASRFPL